MIDPGHATEKEIAERIIALEPSALDRWGNRDPSGFLELCAPDVVYFDPHLELRIDGKEASVSITNDCEGKSPSTVTS